MIDGIKHKTLVILMAGGQGERLYPLTRDRSKPSVPFGGIYRIIDFSLSNCLHSGLRKIEVLTQYKSLSLNRHLQLAWNMFNYNLGEYINTSPPQQRLSSSWYQGTADAIYQNVYTLERSKPQYVLILSGDHVYSMNYQRMLKFHHEKNADLTIGSVEIERSKARSFGVIMQDREGRVTGFKEKPEEPEPLPDNPERCLISMGIYVFNTPMLVRRVIQDAKSDSSHDFGKDVIPVMIRNNDRVFTYKFRSRGNGEAYWRDIGEIDTYWRANMDLLKSPQLLNLNDKQHPVHTYFRLLPPVHISETKNINNAYLSYGCVIENSTIVNSILSPGVEVAKGAEIRDSILFDDVKVGSKAKIFKSIIDKNVKVPSRMIIGKRPQEDNKLFKVTPSGISIIPKEFPL